MRWNSGLPKDFQTSVSVTAFRFILSQTFLRYSQLLINSVDTTSLFMWYMETWFDYVSSLASSSRNFCNCIFFNVYKSSNMKEQQKQNGIKLFATLVELKCLTFIRFICFPILWRPTISLGRQFTWEIQLKLILLLHTSTKIILYFSSHLSNEFRQGFPTQLHFIHQC